MTSRKAAMAVAFLIPILLVLSVMAYASMTATGVNLLGGNKSSAASDPPPLALDGSNFGQMVSVSSLSISLTTARSPDVIIVEVTAYNTGTPTLSSVSDTAGLTWNPRAGPYSEAGNWIWEYYAVASGVLSSDSIKATFSTSQSEIDLGAFGVSGANTGSIFDQHSGLPAEASNPSSNAPTVSVSTSNSNDFIFGLEEDFYGTDTSGTGFTAIYSDSGHSQQSIFTQYEVASAAQSNLAVNVNIPGASPSWILLADAIKAAPSCTTTYSASPTYNTATTVPITISSSGTYCFNAGTYNTQITVTASNVVLTTAPGVNAGQAIIKPTTLAQTSSNPDSGFPEYNIILAGGSPTSSITGVTISNLVVDGSAASSQFTSCANIGYEGVEFLDASGVLTGSTVQNVYLPPAQAGCQPGNDIEVQTASGQTSTVTISNDKALNYNKNGITCNDAGSKCTINSNTVSFYTPYSANIAPNGIQIGFGAVGKVTDNTVSGNECNVPTVCGPDYVTQTQSGGILTFQSGAGTTILGNTVTGNDIGIASVEDAGVTSSANIVQNNRYEGIYLSDGTYSAIANKVSGGDVGIAVVSDGAAANPTTVTLKSNLVTGTLSGASCTETGTPLVPCSPIQAVAYTGSPNGGTNSEPVNLTVNGFSETITAGSSATPSFVDIA